MTIETLYSNLNQENLLTVQQKLVKKLEKKEFVISQKTTYEPLYVLLETLFITEYPNFNYSKEVAQFFLDNEVDNIHSGYRDFQYAALMYLSYMSEKSVKQDVFVKLTHNSNPIVHEKRIKRLKDEVFLKTVLEKYNTAKEPIDFFYKGNKVVFAALQILGFVIDIPDEQAKRLNELIKDETFKLKEILPKLKTI